MPSWVGETIGISAELGVMYEMDPVPALLIPENQRQLCSKEEITDGWSEEHRDSRLISSLA